MLAIGREQRIARREILDALSRVAPASSTSLVITDVINRSSSGSAAGVGIGRQAAVKSQQPMAVPTAPPAPDSGPREAPESGPDAGAGASSSDIHSPESMRAVLQKMEALAAEVASLRSAAVCVGGACQ